MVTSRPGFSGKKTCLGADIFEDGVKWLHQGRDFQVKMFVAVDFHL